MSTEIHFGGSVKRTGTFLSPHPPGRGDTRNICGNADQIATNAAATYPVSPFQVTTYQLPVLP